MDVPIARGALLITRARYSSPLQHVIPDTFHNAMQSTTDDLKSTAYFAVDNHRTENN